MPEAVRQDIPTGAHRSLIRQCLFTEDEMRRVCGVGVGGVRDAAVWLAVVMWIRKQALCGNDVRER